jgi:hypothetical protein
MKKFIELPQKSIIKSIGNECNKNIDDGNANALFLLFFIFMLRLSVNKTASERIFQ